ncbi:NADPH-dependent FMN reductase [Siphonobacter sp.]|uniref:NADPH-dependent FMN reductase n=1 Tax=Siphonobacter sp. TaxID=1869184 RepID=UPI003B3B9815
MITIVSSTNQKNSRSRQIAEYYRQQIQQAGAESRIVDLADLPIDFIYSALYGNFGKHDAFNAIRDSVENASKLIFIVPEYNGSFPGVLKAFLDGFHYPSKLSGKMVALVGISDGGSGNPLGMSHLTDILSFMNATVLGLRVKIPFLKKNWVEGEIQDEFIKTLIHQQVETLVSF